MFVNHLIVQAKLSSQFIATNCFQALGLAQPSEDIAKRVPKVTGRLQLPSRSTQWLVQIMLSDAVVVAIVFVVVVVVAFFLLDSRRF